MRTNFNNEENRVKAEKGLARFEKGMFWLSVLSSSICFYALVMGMLEANGGDFYMQLFASDAGYITKSMLFAAIMYFCHFIDFYGAAVCGKMFFTELGGWLAARANGNALQSFGGIRITSMAFWGILFVGAAATSGLTSYHGSKIVGVFASPKIDNKATTELVSERQKAVDEATKMQREKLQALQNEKAAAIQKAEAGIAGETKRLAKRGNEWAKNEISTAVASASRPYTTKIASAEKELTEAAKQANARFDKIENVQLQNTSAQIETAKQHGNAASWMSALLGVLPLIFGIFAVGIKSLSEVAAKTEKAKAQRSEEGGAMSGAFVGRSKRSAGF